MTEDGTALPDLLAERRVTTVDIVGIATDHCVRASALDAIAHGVHVRILTDLVAGVGADSSAAALAELAHAGAELVDTGTGAGSGTGAGQDAGAEREAGGDA